MSHKRIEIRAVIADVLRRKLSFTTKVHSNRVTNIATDELPAVVVSTPEEEVHVFSAAPRLYLRKLTVVVEAAASGESLDNHLDAHAVEIEEALAAEERLGGLTRELILVKSETVLDQSSDRPLGSVRLTYLATYITDETFPQPMEAFRVAHVRLVQ